MGSYDDYDDDYEDWYHETRYVGGYDWSAGKSARAVAAKTRKSRWRSPTAQSSGSSGKEAGGARAPSSARLSTCRPRKKAIGSFSTTAARRCARS